MKARFTREWAKVKPNCLKKQGDGRPVTVCPGSGSVLTLETVPWYARSGSVSLADHRFSGAEFRVAKRISREWESTLGWRSSAGRASDL